MLLAALAVLALAYVARRRPGAGRAATTGGAAVYLLVLVAVVGVLAWVLPELLFLLFLAFPQVWFMVGVAARRRRCGRWRWAPPATLGPLVHVGAGHRAAVRAGADPRRAGVQPGDGRCG